jgi:hypothetical protein
VSDSTTTERRSEVGIRTRTKAYSLLKCQEHVRSPTSLLLSGYVGSVREIKWPGREIHSSPSSTEVKNENSYTFLSPIRRHGMYGDYCTIRTSCVIFYEGNKTPKTSSIAIETQRMRADIND